MSNLVNISNQIKNIRVTASEIDRILDKSLCKPFVEAYIKHHDSGLETQTCLGGICVKHETLTTFSPNVEKTRIIAAIPILTTFTYKFSNGVFDTPEENSLLYINIVRDFNKSPDAYENKEQPDLSTFFSNLEECETLPICSVLDTYIKDLYTLGYLLTFKQYTHGERLVLEFSKDNYIVAISLDINHWLTCVSTYGTAGLEDF